MFAIVYLLYTIRLNKTIAIYKQQQSLSIQEVLPSLAHTHARTHTQKGTNKEAARPSLCYKSCLLKSSS